MLEILLYGSMDSASNRELALLERIDARLAGIESRIERIERAAPALLAGAVDALDDIADALAARDVDARERLHNVIELLDRASRRSTLDRVARWLDCLDRHPALDAGLIDFAELLADSVGAVQQRAAHKLGPLGLIRALSDASVQRSLGFGLALLRQLGRGLEPPPQAATTRASALPSAAHHD